MIRANELMVGDWALCHGKPMQIMEVLVDSVTAECWPYGYDDVEPIPLTSEILEKNGFKVYEQNFTSNLVYRFGTDYIEYDQYCKYWDIGKYTVSKHFGIEAHFISPMIRVYYVHQFQHALRLCGIDLEIQL